MAESKTSQPAALPAPPELTLSRMASPIPARPSKSRKAVSSDVRALYSLLRKKTIKGRSASGLQATRRSSPKVS